MIGAQKVDSLDASDFEGATIIHDLNEPMPHCYKDRYDVVFDGGTLEHVFNFPVALRNAMEAVKIGGHLILLTPTNNYCGHGFYQFSPELFYRALSEENGYKVEKMIAFSVFQGAKWYEVADPAKCRCRVEIRHDAHQVALLILAKRTHPAEVFKVKPQQSDYAVLWQREVGKHVEKVSFRSRLVEAWRSGRLPYGLLFRVLGSMKLYGLAEGLGNHRWSRRHQPEFFRRVERTEVER
jgi:hypothetical protein